MWLTATFKLCLKVFAPSSIVYEYHKIWMKKTEVNLENKNVTTEVQPEGQADRKMIKGNT